MASRSIKLPKLLERKIYKTGQTRGADDDEIYQNRVGRNSTILIPFSQFPLFLSETTYQMQFENGYIVLISPDDYSNSKMRGLCDKYRLNLGRNLLVFIVEPPNFFGNKDAAQREARTRACTCVGLASATPTRLRKRKCERTMRGSVVTL